MDSLRVFIPLSFAAVLILASCKDSDDRAEKKTESDKSEGKSTMEVTKEPYGKDEQGREIDLYTLINGSGMVVKITNYGALVTAIEVPDRNGKVADVTLGFDSLAPYLKPHPYFGATVGRYANRIANGSFTLDGKTYSLAKNNGVNSLHGGIKGYDKVIWKADAKKEKDKIGVEFKYTSPDGEEGYPGKVSVSVVYWVNKSNEIHIDYTAKSDKATPINLTHHTYFNLAGAASGNVHNHELTMPASKYLPVNDALIPTGELKDVSQTPLDFRAPKKIGERIAQLTGEPGGYDHYWILDKKLGELTLAANLYEPTSGRGMELHTTEPGLQFYSGNFLDGSLKGRDGTVYKKHFGLCLEPTHYPDSPNQPKFPSTILKPGETYKQLSIFKFYVKK